jgi:hypothetical protein
MVIRKGNVSTVRVRLSCTWPCARSVMGWVASRRMKDAGQSTAQVVDLSAVVSFNLITDEQRNVTVDNVEPVITLGELNVKVSVRAWNLPAPSSPPLPSRGPRERVPI